MSSTTQFKPTFLYIKQHKVTKLLYLGITTRRYVERYQGSGKRWRNHLRYHGEFVDTLWYCLFYNYQDLQNAGLLLSNLYNIVESEDWANLIPEDGGKTGIAGTSIKSRETARKRMLSDKNPAYNQTAETRQKISKTNKENMNSLTPEERSQKFGTFGQNNFFHTYNKTVPLSQKQENKACFSYELTSPTGTVFKTISLKHFCDTHQLNRDILRKFINKGAVPFATPHSKQPRINSAGWQITASPYSRLHAPPAQATCSLKEVVSSSSMTFVRSIACR